MHKKVLAIILALLVFIPLVDLYFLENVPDGEGDYIVALHGIARSDKSMRKFANYMRQEGFEVININYPSTRANLGSLVDYVNEVITSRVNDKKKKVHFIGHSMGCLITRALITKHRPDNLGRVVMIAPPNQGSEVADYLKDNFLYKFLFGPAGQQLITDQSEFKKMFGEVNYELGVIAGDSSLAPVGSIIIPGPDDGRVSVKATRIEGMKDHIILPDNHTFIVRDEEAMRQANHFIKFGHFIRPKREDSQK